MELVATPEPEASLAPYRPRQPEKTVLYRALAHSFETFLQVYEERFQPTFGKLGLLRKRLPRQAPT